METTIVIRQKNEMPNLYGETKKETAFNMNVELKTSLHQNFWDEGDDEISKTTWTVKKSIPDLSVLPLRLQIILAGWNLYPGQKRLTISYDNRQDLHMYNDECNDLFDDQFYKISDEERLQLLEVMVDLDVHNNNGWKLNGSHYYEPEKYPPRYSGKEEQDWSLTLD